MKNHLTVGEMGNLFGLNVQTLHYYDKIGLFQPRIRNQHNGRRYYQFDQVYQLATIRYLRKLDCPLEEIKEFLDTRSPAVTKQLLQERSAILQAQWQELMRIDQAIGRKIQFIEEKQAELAGQEVRRVYYPRRLYIPIGSEEALYMKDSFYFYPTIAFYEEDLKYFGAYASGPDLSEDDQDLPQDPEALQSIAEGVYLTCPHFGPYTTIPEHIAQLRADYAHLKLSPLTVTFNIVDHFVDACQDHYVTDLQIQILEDTE